MFIKKFQDGLLWTENLDSMNIITIECWNCGPGVISFEVQVR